ncbi:hypothetical protein [Chamaesiphon sp. OTE_20_metabat_361]|uniref:hypothetical protein n=1 Tax=Chamaesiphon sp. OTE_20_metabat_361 TaxID=2964689 RepID=UPI00286B0162|nr:hypothetical protein [Chamaesiphon sp. OTE_20_metabat_361]
MLIYFASIDEITGWRSIAKLALLSWSMIRPHPALTPPSPPALAPLCLVVAWLIFMVGKPDRKSIRFFIRGEP